MVMDKALEQDPLVLDMAMVLFYEEGNHGPFEYAGEPMQKQYMEKAKEELSAISCEAHPYD